MKLGRLFDQIPFEILARQLAKDSDFVEDMKELLRLDRDLFDELLLAMNAFEGFLDEEQLKKITVRVLHGSGNESDLAEIVSRLGVVIYDTHTPPTRAVSLLSDSIKENTEDFSDDDTAELSSRIKELTVTPPGFAKQQKAKMLHNALLGELEEFQILCDVRPIFDDDRETVDGALPISTVRLQYFGSDGEPEVVEFRLSEEKLDLIEEAVVSAKRKINAIQGLLDKHQVQVPNVKSFDNTER